MPLNDQSICFGSSGSVLTLAAGAASLEVCGWFELALGAAGAVAGSGALVAAGGTAVLLVCGFATCVDVCLVKVVAEAAAGCLSEAAGVLAAGATSLS